MIQALVVLLGPDCDQLKYNFRKLAFLVLNKSMDVLGACVSEGLGSEYNGSVRNI